MKKIIKYITMGKKEISILILISGIISFINVIIPLISKYVFELGIMRNSIKYIMLFSISLIIIYFIKYIICYINECSIAKYSNLVVCKIKKNIIDEVINMPMTFFENHSTAYIISKIGEVNSISSIFSTQIFSFISDLIAMIISLIIIYSKSSSIFYWCLAFIPILYFMSSKSILDIKGISRILFEKNANMNKKMHNFLQGIFTLKALGYEKVAGDLLHEEIENLSKNITSNQKVISKSTYLYKAVTSTVSVIIICIIGLLIIKSKLSLSDYISLSMYIGIIYIPVITFQNFRITLQPALASIERIDELLAYDTETSSEGNLICKKINSISVKKLNFKYNTVPIINGINFELVCGDKLLLTGKNGSGKTTITKLLLGYYKEYDGDICFNGTRMSEFKKNSIRERIAIIQQNTFLFDNSVYENLRMGNIKLDQEGFTSRLKKLLDYGFLKDIDLQLQVIEGGKNLSKGQIQQIAIVRTLIKNYDLYIFDEATSYLDKNSQNLLYRYVNTYLKNKICIFISHNSEFENIANKKISL